MKVGWLLPHQADAVFERLGQGFQKASDRCGGEENIATLWQMCRNGDAMLLVAMDGAEIVMASIWRFQQWDAGTVFRCISLTGSRMKEWTADFDRLAKERARLGGAIKIVFGGRTGWPGVFDEAREIRRTYEVML